MKNLLLSLLVLADIDLENLLVPLRHADCKFASIHCAQSRHSLQKVNLQLVQNEAIRRLLDASVYVELDQYLISATVCVTALAFNSEVPVHRSGIR